jgi:hypothetical protein
MLFICHHHPWSREKNVLEGISLVFFDESLMNGAVLPHMMGSDLVYVCVVRYFQ